jgi:Actinobacteria/chloroflexi VLRF1 release factor
MTAASSCGRSASTSDPALTGTRPATRRLEVDADRLQRWVNGFAERHGAVSASLDPERLSLTAADGSTAVCRVPFPPLGGPHPAAGTAGELAGRVAAHAARPHRVLAVLVRRGGYACAVLEGDRVHASKVGSRYVQSRTAAGGWSQQRFARRRQNQAAELVGAVVEVALRVLVPHAGAGLLVTGGDRALADEVLADRRLSALLRLPRGPHLEVPDPKAGLVADLPRRLRLVRIALTEPVQPSALTEPVQPTETGESDRSGAPG